MTLKEGATYEIESRWPAYKQRNIAISQSIYGESYRKGMVTGIKVVIDMYHDMKENNETEWFISEETTELLDSLLI